MIGGQQAAGSPPGDRWGRVSRDKAVEVQTVALLHVSDGGLDGDGRGDAVRYTATNTQGLEPLSENIHLPTATYTSIPVESRILFLVENTRVIPERTHDPYITGL